MLFQPVGENETDIIVFGAFLYGLHAWRFEIQSKTCVNRARKAIPVLATKIGKHWHWSLSPLSDPQKAEITLRQQ